MTNRENILSLIKRQGYEKISPSFSLCPSLMETYRREEHTDMSYSDKYSFAMGSVSQWKEIKTDPEQYRSYYRQPLKEGTRLDMWGVAHEKGSDAAMHMTRMLHPLENAESADDIINYPLPDYTVINIEQLRAECDGVKHSDKLCIGQMQMTIWETAWYLRGMENLMMDMMSGDETADILLDRVTETAVIRAQNFAKAGADAIFLGDDIGMQKSVMMSEMLYCKYLLPRLKAVIRAAREINPHILVFYHSCGYIMPFIPLLIEAGVDVLNPVQPECMDFAEVHALYGDRLSFYGTIGTQTTFPFGTPDDVKRAVIRNLDIAGKQGGLIVAPTHMLEPEVPWENVKAYIAACRDYA